MLFAADPSVFRKQIAPRDKPNFDAIQKTRHHIRQCGSQMAPR
jgi:hypothetical protein